MIVMFIFDNYTTNLSCLCLYEQIVNEAQPSWLIVLVQQNGGFVVPVPILHYCSWFILNTFRMSWLITYTVLTSCETAIHSCWWWADWPRHCSNDCYFTDQTVWCVACEIVLYIIIMNVSSFIKSEKYQWVLNTAIKISKGYYVYLQLLYSVNTVVVRKILHDR